MADTDLYLLSRGDLRAMVDWPDEIIDEYVAIVEGVEELLTSGS